LGVEEKDVKGLSLKNTVSGIEEVLPVSFMFPGIGHIPNAQAFHGMVNLDEDGYIPGAYPRYCSVSGGVP
jgi:thioredoxin reductase (NADPH)